MEKRKQVISRRRFLEESARGVGAFATASAAMAAAAAEKATNPFAYDVERMAKTDPRLVQYEQVGRFASPLPEPNGMIPSIASAFTRLLAISLMEPSPPTETTTW